jgi:hypothetical protein
MAETPFDKIAAAKPRHYLFFASRQWLIVNCEDGKPFTATGN